MISTTMLFKPIFIFVLAVFLFHSIDTASANSCSPAPGHTDAMCMSPSGGKNITVQIKELCDSDSNPDISCNPNAACPNQVCCSWNCDGSSSPQPEEANIVTPEGQAPGTTEADAATKATAEAEQQKQVDTQVGSDCREPTTGLNFPCIAKGDPQAVVTMVVARLINWILTMTGVIFLVMFIWGGISYMIAGGDSSRAEKARKVLVNSFIGIAIILSSYVILDWLFTALITAIG